MVAEEEEDECVTNHDKMRKSVECMMVSVRGHNLCKCAFVDMRLISVSTIDCRTSFKSPPSMLSL